MTYFHPPAPLQSRQAERTAASVNSPQNCQVRNPLADKISEIAPRVLASSANVSYGCCLHMVKQLMIDSCMTSKSDLDEQIKQVGDSIKAQTEKNVDFSKAKNFGMILESWHYENIIDEVKQGQTLKDLKPGTFLVYATLDRHGNLYHHLWDKNGDRDGEPGHIEVITQSKDNQPQYASFLESSRPRTKNVGLDVHGEFSGDRRKLIGVYVQRECAYQ